MTGFLIYSPGRKIFKSYADKKKWNAAAAQVTRWWRTLRGIHRCFKIWGPPLALPGTTRISNSRYLEFAISFDFQATGFNLRWPALPFLRSSYVGHPLCLSLFPGLLWIPHWPIGSEAHVGSDWPGHDSCFSGPALLLWGVWNPLLKCLGQNRWPGHDPLSFLNGKAGASSFAFTRALQLWPIAE